MCNHFRNIPGARPCSRTTRMKGAGVRLRHILIAIGASCTSASLSAECKSDSSAPKVSDEAAELIVRQDIKKAEAGAEIDRETAKLLLWRIFDPETGKPKPLDVKTKAQYTIDAKYFLERMKAEASTELAAADSVINSVLACLKPEGAAELKAAIEADRSRLRTDAEAAVKAQP